MTAGDIMRTDAVKIREDEPIEEAIRITTSRRINRLPVVDRRGAFMGMIGRDSILRAGIRD